MDSSGKIYYVDNEEEAKRRGLMLMVVSPTRHQRRKMRVGRNDPCPCGSGKKFKKCCYGKEQTHGI